MRPGAVLRWVMLALAGLLAALLSLSLAAPASWWDYGLARVSRDSLLLVPASGNFWRGSGTLQALLPEGRVTTLARVAWRVDLSAWYRAQLGLRLTEDGNGRELLLARWSPAGVEIETLQLNLPASWLGHFSATVRDAALTGQLQFASRQLHIDRAGGQGQAEVVWRGAGSQLVSRQNLGDYRLGFSLRGGELQLALTTLQGQVQLQGDGQWRLGQRPNMNFVARPAPELARSLEPMLRIFGKDQGDGSYRIVPML